MALFGGSASSSRAGAEPGGREREEGRKGEGREGGRERGGGEGGREGEGRGGGREGGRESVNAHGISL